MNVESWVTSRSALERRFKPQWKSVLNKCSDDRFLSPLNHRVKSVMWKQHFHKSWSFWTQTSIMSWSRTTGAMSNPWRRSYTTFTPTTAYPKSTRRLRCVLLTYEHCYSSLGIGLAKSLPKVCWIVSDFNFYWWQHNYFLEVNKVKQCLGGWCMKFNLIKLDYLKRHSSMQWC